MFSEKRIYRVGTGEFTDSMIWEYLMEYSAFLVPFFAKQDRSVLELKTKTVDIDALEHLDHRRKTIMAWSVNTEKVIRTEERNTASLDERLAAASRCEQWGYPLAFHFDPMILYDGCLEEYPEVVDRIFSRVSPENIVWISLGAFRFIPSLKSIVQMRFPESKIVYGEFVPGVDGKMRYFKPLRIELYRRMIERIRAHAPEPTAYFCMEDDEVWEKTFGFTPKSQGGLPRILDGSAIRHCRLNKNLF